MPRIGIAVIAVTKRRTQSVDRPDGQQRLDIGNRGPGVPYKNFTGDAHSTIATFR